MVGCDAPFYNLALRASGNGCANPITHGYLWSAIDNLLELPRNGYTNVHMGCVCACKGRDGNKLKSKI